MSSLETIAELAIALAGFAGIIFVFSDSDSPIDIRKWRVRNLLTISFATMLAALVPLGLPSLGLTDSYVWRISSGVLAILLTLLLISAIPVFYRLDVSSRSRLGSRFFYSIIPILIVCDLFQVLNVMGIFNTARYAIFYYGLILFLAIGAAQFVVSVLDSDGDNA